MTSKRIEVFAIGIFLAIACFVAGRLYDNKSQGGVFIPLNCDKCRVAATFGKLPDHHWDEVENLRHHFVVTKYTTQDDFYLITTKDHSGNDQEHRIHSKEWLFIPALVEHLPAYFD